jgi:hypothetical protein
MKNNILKTAVSLILVFIIHTGLIAQEATPNVGIAVYLKPIPSMGYEFNQALTHYNKTHRTDPKYAVRVSPIIGGPRSLNILMTEPLKTWAEMDEIRPYQNATSARDWQNVLKYCEEYQIVYYMYDTYNSNPLPVKPTTKYISYFWEIDPKANDEAFAAELKKAGELLRKGGYNIVMTRSLSGRITYQIQVQYENGWKDMEKNLPGYKELFLKAYPGKGEYEKHNNILINAVKDFYVEYRTTRPALSTR